MNGIGLLLLAGGVTYSVSASVKFRGPDKRDIFDLLCLWYIVCLCLLLIKKTAAIHNEVGEKESQERATTDLFFCSRVFGFLKEEG